MKNDREASARKVGTALLAALNDRDHRLLVTFRCDDVVIEVASQVSVLDPADLVTEGSLRAMSFSIDDVSPTAPVYTVRA